MAVPRIVTVRDFNTSRFSQLADTSTANIGDILARAESAVESKLNRPVVPTQYTEVYRPATNTIYLRRRPVISIDSFTRQYSVGGLPLTVAEYTFDSDTGVIDSGGLIIGMVVTVVYTAGFTTTPEDIKEAILMQAALFTFQDLEIYGSGDAKEPGIMYMHRDIERLLAPYKQIHTAYTREYV
jgi:hypothetical protein